MIQQLTYHNGNKILVGVAEKAGSSTAIATMGYPVMGSFKYRDERNPLIRKGLWKEIYYSNVKNWDSFPVRIAIVRDPVERFISCYKDRIANKNKDNVQSYIKNFNDFVNNIELVRKKSKDIYKHTLPFTQILGTAKNYTHIILTKNIDTEFVDLIKEVSGNNNVPIVRHKMSRKAKDIIPTEDEIKIIKEYYKADYEEYGSYFI